MARADKYKSSLNNDNYYIVIFLVAGDVEINNQEQDIFKHLVSIYIYTWYICMYI